MVSIERKLLRSHCQWVCSILTIGCNIMFISETRSMLVFPSLFSSLPTCALFSFPKDCWDPCGCSHHDELAACMHLHRCRVPTWVFATMLPHLHTCVGMTSAAQTTHGQLYRLRQITANKSFWIQTKPQYLKYKLLFKYTRLSLVLADILNVSF